MGNRVRSVFILTRVYILFDTLALGSIDLTTRFIFDQQMLCNSKLHQLRISKGKNNKLGMKTCSYKVGWNVRDFQIKQLQQINSK